MLTILLGYLSYQTSRKGCELHAKEVAAEAKKVREAAGDADDD